MLCAEWLPFTGLLLAAPHLRGARLACRALWKRLCACARLAPPPEQLQGELLAYRVKKPLTLCTSLHTVSGRERHGQRSPPDTAKPQALRAWQSHDEPPSAAAAAVLVCSCVGAHMRAGQTVRRAWRSRAHPCWAVAQSTGQ